MTRNRDERGTALVELPAAFIAISVFMLCVTALGQLLLEYHHLTGAARAAARYATKSDPRLPAADDVVVYARDAAAPVPASEVDVRLTPDDIAGTGITVEVRHRVNGGAYELVTSTANGLLQLVGADPLPDVTLRATSTAIYE